MINVVLNRAMQHDVVRASHWGQLLVKQHIIELFDLLNQGSIGFDEPSDCLSPGRWRSIRHLRPSRLTLYPKQVRAFQ